MKHVFLCSSPYHLSIDYGIQGTENVAYNLKKILQFHEASLNSDSSHTSAMIFII